MTPAPFIASGVLGNGLAMTFRRGILAGRFWLLPRVVLIRGLYGSLKSLLIFNHNDPARARPGVLFKPGQTGGKPRAHG